MEGYIRFGIIIFTLVLSFLVAWDIGNTLIIKKRWPKGLSKETTLELWYLYSIEDVEFYRVHKRSYLLRNYVSFFLSGYQVPSDCGVDNPVVLLCDLTSNMDYPFVMSRAFFERNYKKYMKFDSFEEYDKYWANLK